MKEEISKVVKIQEELDIDVLVHGEPEVSSIERTSIIDVDN
jgi:methionine synthase II (cobalamin-independent)